MRIVINAENNTTENNEKGLFNALMLINTIDALAVRREQDAQDARRARYIQYATDMGWCVAIDRKTGKAFVPKDFQG